MDKLKTNYNTLSFREFADSLYRTEGVRIFYKSKWMDEVIMHHPTDVYTLDEILRLNLEPHNISYYTDSYSRVYLTSNTSFPHTPER